MIRLLCFQLAALSVCAEGSLAAVIWNEVDTEKGVLDYVGMVDNQLEVFSAPDALHTVYNMIDTAFCT